jgi:hypothetical protein
MSYRDSTNNDGTGARTVRGGRVSTALAFKSEAMRVVPDALRRDRRSAKVIALKVGATPKAVEKWRQGESIPSAPYFFALALEVPELRSLVCQWLNLAPNDPRAKRIMDFIKAEVMQAPEEGDIENV